MAVIGEEKPVIVAGYFNYHFEGCGLQTKPDATDTEDLLLLWWIDTPALEPRQAVRTFDGKWVKIVGTLKKGRFLGSRSPDVPVLWATSIKEANQPVQRTGAGARR